MSKQFGDMTVDEQAKLIQEVADCLKDNDLGDVKPSIYREEVCQLTQAEVQGRTLLKVEKTLPSTEKAKADRFKAAIEPVIKGIEGVNINVNSVLGVGDEYVAIKNVTTLDDMTPVNIEHTPGTVMFIDFWATWCPPCQKPMAHNQEMLQEHGAKWGENVKIIGLSIDKDAETVKSHITNKGWTSPIHYHRAKSDCSEVYQVKGVPHVLLVDKKGKIVFKGHPAGRKDLVADFNTLLEDKELDGVEAPGEKKEEGDDKESGSASLDDIKAAMAEMTKFRETGKELQKDCKESATGMMRNFCVLTLDASLNPKTGAWTSEYMNHRVLVGPKEKVDSCKAKIEEKMGVEAERMGWTFKFNEQIQAM